MVGAGVVGLTVAGMVANRDVRTLTQETDPAPDAAPDFGPTPEPKATPAGEHQP